MTKATLAYTVTNVVNDNEYYFYDEVICDDCPKYGGWAWGTEWALRGHRPGLKYHVDGNNVTRAIGSYTGGQVSLTYDPNQSGASLSYLYDDSGQVTEIKVGNDTLLEIEYNGNGWVTRQSGGCPSCGLGEEEYKYDSYGNVEMVKDAYGNCIERRYIDYGINGGVVTKMAMGETGTLLQWQDVYDYDHNENTFKSFNVTKYSYVSNSSKRARIEEFQSAAMATPTRVYVYKDLNPDLAIGTRYETIYFRNKTGKIFGTTSENDVVRASYWNDSTGLVTKDVLIHLGEEIPLATYDYASVSYGGGLNITHMTSATDARVAETTYHYADKGLLTKQVDPETDGDKLTHYYEYDSLQRVTSECRGSGETSFVTTQYAYDYLDNLIEAIEAYGSALAATTEYAYDIYNRQTMITDPAGNARTQVYSLGGLLEQEAVFASGTSGDVLSQTHYEYDNNTRMTRKLVADHPGAFAMDNPTGWIITLYEYDIFGRQTAVVEDAADLKLTTRYQYNNQGEVDKTTMPGGVWTLTERDGRGLQTSQIVGYEGSTSSTELTTSYEYDGDGNLTTLTAPSGEVTMYQYDGFGRRTKVVKG